MFTEALFTIAKTQEQPKCPLTDERIKKMWCMYTVKYYSVIKKKKWNNAIWMDQLDRPREYHTKLDKDKYHMTSLICGIKNMTQIKSYW